MIKHQVEDLVKEAISHPSHSNTRKLVFEKIRNLGDFHHNRSVIRQGRDEIVPWRCPCLPHPKPAREYVPCSCCFAFFQERQLWWHHQQCHFYVHVDRKHSFRSLRMEAYCLLPSSNMISSVLEN
jgi:ferredoxin-thioredoxin reductase catalytic subunit